MVPVRGQIRCLTPYLAGLLPHRILPRLTMGQALLVQRKRQPDMYHHPYLPFRRRLRLLQVRSELELPTT